GGNICFLFPCPSCMRAKSLSSTHLCVSLMMMNLCLPLLGSSSILEFLLEVVRWPLANKCSLSAPLRNVSVWLGKEVLVGNPLSRPLLRHNN
ncbi:hypothetical protein HAX54_003132, partial [Datura stramonium]|nr:hypothetical protein [Datura stramonium]